jgi:hypothetical protein
MGSPVDYLGLKRLETQHATLRLEASTKLAQPRAGTEWANFCRSYGALCMGSLVDFLRLKRLETQDAMFRLEPSAKLAHPGGSATRACQIQL